MLRQFKTSSRTRSVFSHLQGALACSALLTACGLDVQIPDGVVECQDDSECPSGFVCTDRGDGSYCYKADGGDGSGGSSNTGGDAGTGGTMATGGMSGSGGSQGSGGSGSTGGSSNTGGSDMSGGTMGTGGATNSGGTMNTGGTNANDPPVVSIDVSATMVQPGASVDVDCFATDANNDSVTLELLSSAGSLASSSPPAAWTAPWSPGDYNLVCNGEDSNGATDSDSAVVTVPDVPPVIDTIGALPPVVIASGNAAVTCQASDQNDPTGNSLVYQWSSDWGYFNNVTNPSTTFHNQAMSGTQTIGDNHVRCKVSDPGGHEANREFVLRALPEGLTSYHRFNERLIDLAPDPQAATLLGGNENYGADSANIDKQAFAFDGSTALQLPGAENIAGEWTFAAWLMIDSNATEYMTLWSRAGGALALPSYGQFSFSIKPDGGGSATFYLGSDGAVSGTAVDTGVSIAMGEWHHVTLTLRTSDSTATLYIDGKNPTPFAFTPGGPKQSTPILGARFGGTEPYLGMMDEVQVYTRELNDTEIGVIAGLQ